MKITSTTAVQKALILSGVAAIALSSPAYAGFQWKGPVAPPPAAAASAPDADMSDLAPVTAPNGQTTLAPPAVAPVVATPAPVAPAPVATPVAAPADAADVVNGFGAGVPLVMALQQIVPPGYQYSFSSGVNPGVSVSWQGGKSWHTVLSDMLATQNLGYRVQNNVVVVGDFPMPEAAPAAQPVATVQPVVMTPATKADQIPADMMGAKPSVAPEAAPEQKPVDIRRERPEAHKRTFWERLTGTGGDDDNGDNNAPAVNTVVPPSSSSSAAPVTNSADARAMNAARAMTDSNNVSTQNDLTVPPASVSHPAGGSMADQAMAGAVVKSQVPDSTDWGTPSSTSTTANVPSAALSSAPAMPAVAPAPVAVAPVADDSNHAVSLTDTAPVSTPAAPVVASVSAPVASGMKGDWVAQKGDTLRDVLKNWSDKAGVQLYWSIDYNYRINGNLDYTGAYDDAVAKLLDQFSTVRPQPYGQLHQGSDGPRVLVVKSYDLSR